MQVKIQDVVLGMEAGNSNERVFYNPGTEEMEYLAGGSGEPEENWIELPDKQEINEYGMMEDFIAGVEDEKAKEWLTNAIHGRGAFRMFRATLDRFDLREQWYQYREREYESLAVAWCEYYGIEHDYFQTGWEEEEEMPAAAVPVSSARVVEVRRENIPAVVYMAADLQVILGRENEADIEKAQVHLEEMLEEQKMIMAVSAGGRFAGYAAADLNQKELLEIYIRPEERRKGLGTRLLKEAEEAAGGSLRIMVRPEDEAVLSFLRAAGYNQLRYYIITK